MQIPLLPQSCLIDAESSPGPAAPAGGEDGKQTAVFEKEEVPGPRRRASDISRLDGSQRRIAYASRAAGRSVRLPVFLSLSAS